MRCLGWQCFGSFLDSYCSAAPLSLGINFALHLSFRPYAKNYYFHPYTLNNLHPPTRLTSDTALRCEDPHKCSIGSLYRISKAGIWSH